MDGRDQFRRRRFFDHVARRTGPQHLKDVFRIGVHGQDEYFDVRILCGDLAGCFQAIEVRHTDVHQYDVRQQLLCQANGRSPILGLTNHFNVVFTVQNGA